MQCRRLGSDGKGSPPPGSTGMAAPFFYDGAKVFLAYAQQLLVPIMPEGDIVVIASLGGRHSFGMRS